MRMFNEEGDGDNCYHCTQWIQNTGDCWFCEECDTPTCESCGKFESEEKVFLCPDCFTKEQ